MHSVNSHDNAYVSYIGVTGHYDSISSQSFFSMSCMI